jgi:hypothetical protein
MTAAELTRARERFDGDAGPLDLAPLAGRWITFSEETEGIAEVEVATAGGDVTARVLGSGHRGPVDWGKTPARVFAGDVAGGEVWGFRASYDHGYERVELFGYLNRGLLCVEAGTTFADESGRAPYFTRSFYFRP